MKPTDIGNPEYFHKVVDCQYACPAHTPVPEYIRLIAAGRYADAYMINWQSNVFPGVLGRTCDRPCEPACRRERVEEQPVAICRLKRVAADNKGDIRKRLPKIKRRDCSIRSGSARRDYILDMGVTTFFETEVTSMREILDQDYDAVFVGTGAPRGKGLDLPGLEEAGDKVHLGIDWLASVAFEHTHAIGKRVLVLHRDTGVVVYV